MPPTADATRSIDITLPKAQHYKHLGAGSTNDLDQEPGRPTEPEDRQAFSRFIALGTHSAFTAEALTGRTRGCGSFTERAASAALFRDAYAKRRCIVPVDCFFEWRAIKGKGAKQPYAIAMKGRNPFGLVGIWENWQHPETDEWIRTFAIITTDANELVAPIHDRMPVILAPRDFDRWLSSLDPDPRDLLRPYPAAPLTLWPISIRVNSPENDDPSIIEPRRASIGITLGASGYGCAKGQSSFAQGTKRVPSDASRNREGLYHIQLSAFWITHGLR